MPMTRLPEISAKKPVPISDAFGMQFGTELFCYRCLLTNRTRSIFVPIYGTVPVFAARRICIVRTMPWHIRPSVTRRYSVETAKTYQSFFFTE